MSECSMFQLRQSTLQSWLYDHRHCPFPDSHEQQMLASRCYMTKKQVANWFCHARRRLLPKMIRKEREICKNRDRFLFLSTTAVERYLNSNSKDARINATNVANSSRTRLCSGSSRDTTDRFYNLNLLAIVAATINH